MAKLSLTDLALFCIGVNVQAIIDRFDGEKKNYYV